MLRYDRINKSCLSFSNSSITSTSVSLSGKSIKMSPPAWLPPLNSHSNSLTCLSVEQLELPSSKKDQCTIHTDVRVVFRISDPNQGPFYGMKLRVKSPKSYNFLNSSPSAIKLFICSLLSYLRVPVKLDRVFLERRHFDTDEFSSSMESAESFAVRILEFLVSMRNKSYNAGHKKLPFHFMITKLIGISDDEYKEWTAWYEEKKMVDPNFERDYDIAISRPRTYEELWYEEALRFKAATQFAIKTLKDVRIDDSNSTADCLVCLEQMEYGSKAVCLPCSHVFHGNCIIKWLQESHMCPLCRYRLPSVCN